VRSLFHTGTCPDDWHQYGVNCFYMSDNRARHGTARSYCQAMDAELASISNQQEMNFVKAKTFVAEITVVRILHLLKPTNRLEFYSNP